MSKFPRTRRIRRIDRNRFVWPPARSDAAAGVSFGAMVVLFSTGQPLWGAGSLVLCVSALLWPSSEGIKAGASQDEGVFLDAKRHIDAPYVVEEPKEPPEP